jgi:hypothetical protein
MLRALPVQFDSLLRVFPPCGTSVGRVGTTTALYLLGDSAIQNQHTIESSDGESTIIKITGITGITAHIMHVIVVDFPYNRI